ncbi:MAG TPA: DciA family protein [bacterium]|nr:DciA family protein [bacterium]
MTEKKISEILTDVLKNIGRPLETRYNEIIDWDKIWAEICGDARQFSYAQKMKNDILYIYVKNSAWLLELRKNKNQYMKILQQKTGKTLKDIRFYR